MVDDFERMWSDLAPVGRSATSGGYFRQPFTPARARARRLVPRAGRRPATSTSSPTTPATWSPGGTRGGSPDWTAGRPRHRDGVLTGSHLDSVLDGGAYDGPLGVVLALAAVDVLRAAGRRAGAADRGLGLRRGGGVAVRAGLPGLAAGHRRARRGSRRGCCATATAWPSRRSSRAAAPGCWPASGPSWSCTSSRAATWSTAAPRSGWPARSGRTGATASTSRARPTTPAPPGWRTAPTRCSPTR